MNAGTFVILSGKDPGVHSHAAAYTALQDSIERLAEYSGSRGMSIVLEKFDRSVERKMLVSPADEAARFANLVRIEHPSFSLLYDMGHMPLLGESLHGAPHLTDVHLGNCMVDPVNPLYGDKHPCFGCPGGGAGVDELAAFLRELSAVGFLQKRDHGESLPWVSFEVRLHAGETTQDILENIQFAWQAT